MALVPVRLGILPVLWGLTGLGPATTTGTEDSNAHFPVLNSNGHHIVSSQSSAQYAHSSILDSSHNLDTGLRVPTDDLNSNVRVHNENNKDATGTPLPAQLFVILRGSNFCQVTNSGGCITINPTLGRENQECAVRVQYDTKLVSTEPAYSFSTSPIGDKKHLEHIEEQYSRLHGNSNIRDQSAWHPKALEVSAGTVLSWGINYLDAERAISLCHPTVREAKSLVGTSDKDQYHYSFRSQAAKTPITSCGNHVSLSGCGGCPQGNGRSWCNGDCVWSDRWQLCIPAQEFVWDGEKAQQWSQHLKQWKPSIEIIDETSCTMPALHQFVGNASRGRAASQGSSKNTKPIGQQVNVVDLTSCLHLCVETGKTCKSIEFDELKSMCYLRKDYVSKEIVERTDRWLYWNREWFCNTTANDCTGGPLDHFSKQTSRTFSRKMLWKVVASSESCAKQCLEQDPPCLSFAFDSKTAACALWEEYSPPQVLLPIVGVTVFVHVGLASRGCSEVTMTSVAPHLQNTKLQ